MPLNATQKYALRAFLELELLDYLRERISVTLEEKLKTLRYLVNLGRGARNPFTVPQCLKEEIKSIIDVLEHPFPQNRKIGSEYLDSSVLMLEPPHTTPNNLLVFAGVTSLNGTPIVLAEPWGHGNGIIAEHQGLLGLSSHVDEEALISQCENCHPLGGNGLTNITPYNPPQITKHDVVTEIIEVLTAEIAAINALKRLFTTNSESQIVADLLQQGEKVISLGVRYMAKFAATKLVDTTKTCPAFQQLVLDAISNDDSNYEDSICFLLLKSESGYSLLSPFANQVVPIANALSKKTIDVLTKSKQPNELRRLFRASREYGPFCVIILKTMETMQLDNICSLALAEAINFFLYVLNNVMPTPKAKTVEIAFGSQTALWLFSQLLSTKDAAKINVIVSSLPRLYHATKCLEAECVFALTPATQRQLAEILETFVLANAEAAGPFYLTTLSSHRGNDTTPTLFHNDDNKNFIFTFNFLTKNRGEWLEFYLQNYLLHQEPATKAASNIVEIMRQVQSTHDKKRIGKSRWNLLVINHIKSFFPSVYQDICSQLKLSPRTEVVFSPSAKRKWKEAIPFSHKQANQHNITKAQLSTKLLTNIASS